MQYQDHITDQPLSHQPVAGEHSAMANGCPVLPDNSLNYPTGSEGELFHNIIHTYRRDTKAPLSLCIQAALGIGAFIQQGLVELKSPSGHITPPSLVIFGILEPAGGKSTVMEKFTAPVDQFIDAHKIKNQALDAEHSHQKEIWDQTRKKLLRDLAKVKADAAIKGEGSDAAKYQKALEKVDTISNALDKHVKNSPKPPSSVGLGILSDATPAAIPKFIKDNRIQSLAIISAEAEEFLNKGIKNHSSILNKGFSGEKTSKHLATRGDESYDIPMTAMLFGQPYIMDKAFGGDNNRMRGTGTVSRSLFSCPQSNIGFQHSQSNSTFGKLSASLHTKINDPNAETNYHRWATALLNQNKSLFESGGSRKRLKLSNDAIDIWYRGRAELDLDLRPDGRYAEFRDHGNRLPEQWLRVALVIHGYNHHGHDEISATTLRLAIELVNCFSTEFQAIFRQSSQEERDIMKLQKWCHDKREQNRRYIAKSIVTTSNPLRPSARLNIALQALLHNHQIGIMSISCQNHRGQATKPMTVIDLLPGQPINQWAIDQAVFQARELNNG